MTGIANFNFPAFHSAARSLRQAGYDVVSPAEVSPDQSRSWNEAMRIDLRAMLECDTVALLPGWEDSKGAKIESELARIIGILVIPINDILVSNE